jgi:hypothetical protein
MDENEEVEGPGAGLMNEPKLNLRDKRLLEVDNPEEDVKNPFASGFQDPHQP